MSWKSWIFLFCFCGCNFCFVLSICTVTTCCNSILICTFKNQLSICFKNSKMWETAKEHSIECPNCQIAKFFIRLRPKSVPSFDQRIYAWDDFCENLFDSWEPHLNYVSQIVSLNRDKIWLNKIGAVSCSPYTPGWVRVKMGLGLTGKLGCAWFCAWVIHGMLQVQLHGAWCMVYGACFPSPPKNWIDGTRQRRDLNPPPPGIIQVPQDHGVLITMHWMFI